MTHLIWKYMFIFHLELCPWYNTQEPSLWDIYQICFIWSPFMLLWHNPFIFSQLLTYDICLCLTLNVYLSSNWCNGLELSTCEVYWCYCSDRHDNSHHDNSILWGKLCLIEQIILKIQLGVLRNVIGFSSYEYWVWLETIGKN